MHNLLKRMEDVQDRLLDNLGETLPTTQGVLETFEAAHSAMREAAEELNRYKQDELPVPEELKQAIAMGAQFGQLMQRVKERLDATLRPA